MAALKVKNKETGIQYLVGTVDEYGEFWCFMETPYKDQALRQARKFDKPTLKNPWIVVEQTTTFKQVTE